MFDRLWWGGWGLCLCLAAGLAGGCAPASGTPGKLGDQAAAVPREELPGGEMPSMEEATELAQQIEAAMAVGDDSVMNKTVDWNLVCSRSIAGIDAPKDMQIEYRTGLLKGITDKGGLPKQVAQQVLQGGSYRLMDVRQKDGEIRALFRLLLPEAGVNYHDLLLVRDNGGRARVGDIYVFLSAEDLSTTFRRFYVAMLAENDRSLLEKLSGKTAELANHMDEFQAMGTRIRTGQFREALDIYESLPEVLKTEKAVLILRYQAAVGVGSAETIQAVREFKKHYPDDACIDFLSIDLHASTGDFDQALECVDQVEKSVGDDPYLNVLRASCLVAAKRYEAAKQAANAAVEAEPDLIQAYWTLVTISLETKDFEEVTRLLDRIAANFEIEFYDLTQVPEYAEYVKSPEYEKWLESRAQKHLESNPLVQ